MCTAFIALSIVLASCSYRCAAGTLGLLCYLVGMLGALLSKLYLHTHFKLIYPIQGVNGAQQPVRPLSPVVQKLHCLASPSQPPPTGDPPETDGLTGTAHAPPPSHAAHAHADPYGAHAARAQGDPQAAQGHSTSPPRTAGMHICIHNRMWHVWSEASLLYPRLHTLKHKSHTSQAPYL